MEPLSRLLPKTLSRLGLTEHAQASLTVHLAQTWISERLPGLSDAISVRSVDGNILVIQCQHPIAAQELRPVTADLLAYLAARIGPRAPSEARMTRS